MERIYYLTLVEVRCPCGNVLNIRSKERVAQVSCWKCKEHSAKLVQGYGQNNYRVSIINHATGKETTVKPSHVVQKRPEQE
jgi:hypothetical protein